MIEKGIASFNIVLADFLGVSLPLALAGIIDMFTLPVRLVLALLTGP